MSAGRTASVVVGLLLVIFGSVFALQGVGVIGGSFMSNNPTYIYVGGALVVVGLLLLIFAKRFPSMKSHSTEVSSRIDSKS